MSQASTVPDQPLCRNGDDHPVRLPSGVLCEQCQREFQKKLNRRLVDALEALQTIRASERAWK